MICFSMKGQAVSEGTQVSGEGTVTASLMVTKFHRNHPKTRALKHERNNYCFSIHV